MVVHYPSCWRIFLHLRQKATAWNMQVPMGLDVLESREKIRQSNQDSHQQAWRYNVIFTYRLRMDTRIPMGSESSLHIGQPCGSECLAYRQQIKTWIVAIMFVRKINNKTVVFVIAGPLLWIHVGPEHAAIHGEGSIFIWHVHGTFCIHDFFFHPEARS